MEKLLLEAFFSFHELDVVNEQNVHISVAALERCGGVCTNCVDVFVQESFGGDIANFVVRVVVVHVPTDGLQEVSLAKSG